MLYNRIAMKKLFFLLFPLFLFSSCEYIADKIWTKEDITYINKSSYEVIFTDEDKAQFTLPAGSSCTAKGYGSPNVTIINNVPVNYSKDSYSGTFTDMTPTTIIIKNTKNEAVIFRCGNSKYNYKETLPASSEKTLKVFSYDGISVLSEKQTFAISFTTNTVNEIIYIYI